MHNGHLSLETLRRGDLAVQGLQLKGRNRSRIAEAGGEETLFRQGASFLLDFFVVSLVTDGGPVPLPIESFQGRRARVPVFEVRQHGALREELFGALQVRGGASQ